jgi:hypothetical protein
VLESEEDVVVDLGAGPRPPHLRVYRQRRAQQLERLIDQVRAEVEQQAARVLAVAGLTPLARVHLGPPALEARLEAHELAERAVRHKPPKREEVAVPATVVEDARHHAALSGRVGQPLGVRHARRERLVHDQVQPGVHRRKPERHVLAVRGCNHDQVMRIGPGEQRVGIGQDDHPGMSPLRAVGPLGVGGDDRGQREPGHRLDERRVERRAREAVPDQPNTEWGPIRRGAQTRPAACR